MSKDYIDKAVDLVRRSATKNKRAARRMVRRGIRKAFKAEFIRRVDHELLHGTGTGEPPVGLLHFEFEE